MDDSNKNIEKTTSSFLQDGFSATNPFVNKLPSPTLQSDASQSSYTPLEPALDDDFEILNTPYTQFENTTTSTTVTNQNETNLLEDNIDYLIAKSHYKNDGKTHATHQKQDSKKRTIDSLLDQQYTDYGVLQDGKPSSLFTTPAKQNKSLSSKLNFTPVSAPPINNTRTLANIGILLPPRFYFVIHPEILQRKCYKDENRYIKPNPLIVRLYDNWHGKIENGSFDIHLIYANGNFVESKNPPLICEEGMSRALSKEEHEYPCSLKLKANSGVAGLRLLVDFSYKTVDGVAYREIIMTTPFFVANKSNFAGLHPSDTSTVAVGASFVVPPTELNMYSVAKELLSSHKL